MDDKKIKKDKKNKKEEGSPAWMTTYGDMVTLLLCFFILLFSMATVDVAKFEQVVSSLRSTFHQEASGILEDSHDVIDSDEIDSSDIDSISKEQEMLEEFYDEFYQTYQMLKESIEKVGLDDDIGIRLEDRGIILELSEAVLFDSGQAELKPESKELLKYVSIVLEELPTNALVEGHTDNVPMAQTTLFSCNWELSVGRAVAVVKYFTEKRELSPERFVASGYGEYNPIATNETSEGRAENRRVNIVLLASEIPDFELEEDVLP